MSNYSNLSFVALCDNGRSLTVRVLVPAAERSVCVKCGSGLGRFRYGWDYGDNATYTKAGYCSVSCWRNDSNRHNRGFVYSR